MTNDEPERAAERLRELLQTVKPGLIEDTYAINTLMYESWDYFDGSSAQGMNRDKLFCRVEDLEWDPPCLTFVIERHGAMVVGGSIKKEKQHWTLDLDEFTARCAKAGYRLNEPRQPNLDLEPLVEKVVEAVKSGRDARFLRWRDPQHVLVDVSAVLPYTPNKETQNGRSKRFRAKLFPALERLGWSLIPKSRYRFKKKAASATPGSQS
jgi:hypothetical protein